MTYAIEVKNLTKTFGQYPAVNQVSFKVESGKIFALLGENGAGKTTTIHLLTTLLTPTSGEILYNGTAAAKRSIRKQISVTGQFAALDEELTGRENLEILGQLHSLSRKAAKAKALELLKQFELEAAADKKVTNYSGGMKRRLDIAVSLLGDPKILFLDEPTTGIDPANRRRIWEMIDQLAKDSGMTIFLTTQYLEEAEVLADFVTIMNQGKVIAEGSVDTLKKSLPESKIQLKFADKNILESAKKILAVEHLEELSENRLEIPVIEKVKKVSSIFTNLTSAGIAIEDIQLVEPTLEDVYLELTRRGNHAVVS
ncbi:ATP-binding cassette domain-containing protein [Enterococcus mediterraneensis]|uniref:ATP-binding cassette domain-containing protein n=1 Tax=Enterococcus mediterraneensis TaxID=2364791 RepID=UPI001F151212|nr:ATP-binding cassette domain-containing protein [Enterococcus mediterraneensis]